MWCSGALLFLIDYLVGAHKLIAKAEERQSTPLPIIFFFVPCGLFSEVNIYKLIAIHFCMLEKILDGIVTCEKYTVRVVDEGVHRLVDRTLATCGLKENWKRKNLATLLTGISGFTIYPMVAVSCFKDMIDHSIWGGHYQGEAYFDMSVLKSMLKIVALPRLIIFDLDNIQNSFEAAQSDGTQTGDKVYSHTSFSGIIRPYVLGTSLALLADGVVNQNAEHFKWGMLTLPYALSLYIRDNQSGGLLERIKQNVISLFRQHASAHTAARYTQ